MRKLIHDYALEPELAADSDADLYQYLLNHKKFGWDAGCVIVQYPGTWIERVEKLPHDKRKLELLLSFLRKKGIICKDPIDDTICWLKNAEGLPFHAILARDNPRSQPNVVRGADIYSGSRTADRAWDQPPPSITVDRTAASMAACIEPMLRYATRIRFIDPHFCALHERFQDPLCEFLRIICDSKRAVTLELHASVTRSLEANALADKKSSWEVFRQECEELPRIIPKDFTLTIYLWKERKKGQGFHNRYILTDIGSVQLGTGLDRETTKGSQDQDIITRLSSFDSQIWLNKYSGPTPAFDLKGKEDIRGCRNI